MKFIYLKFLSNLPGANELISPRGKITVMVHSEQRQKQVSFKKEVGVMVIDLVVWLTLCLILKMCY